MGEALEVAVGGLMQGSVFALVAIGFALVFRVTGAVNLTQGAFVVLGALSMYSFQTGFGWPIPLAFAAAIVVSLAVGFAVGKFVFEPALRTLPGSGMVMLTGGLLTVCEGAALLIWGSQPYQLVPYSGFRPYDVFGIRIPTQGVWIFGVSAVVVLVLAYVLQRTTLGKALRACAENPAAASLMGIDVRRMTVLSFAVASALGALAGIIVGPIVSLQFDSVTSFTISGFISGALGGLASIFGSIVGGLGLGLTQQLASWKANSLFSTTLSLALLMIVLIFRPSGLFSRTQARREDVREASLHAAHLAVRFDRSTGRVLVVLALALILSMPLLLGGSGALSSIVITGIIFIAVIGLDVLMGYAGQVSLGHSAFVAIGAYAAAIFTVRLGVPSILSVVFALGVSLSCAALLAAVTVRLRGHYMALATLAFGLFVDSLVVGLTNLTGGPSGLPGIPHLSIGPLVFDSQIANYYLVWGIAVAGIIIVANAMRSDFGRALRAIRTDQTAARALGIDVTRCKLYAFLISAGFASIAGSLYAFYFQYLSSEMVDTSRSLAMVTMLVVGGEASLIGPVIGVAMLTILPTVFQPLASAKTLVTGIILVLTLLYLPQGLFGGLAMLLNRLGGPRAPRPLGAAAFEAARSR